MGVVIEVDIELAPEALLQWPSRLPFCFHFYLGSSQIDSRLKMNLIWGIVKWKLFLLNVKYQKIKILLMFLPIKQLITLTLQCVIHFGFFLVIIWHSCSYCCSLNINLCFTMFLKFYLYLRKIDWHYFYQLNVHQYLCNKFVSWWILCPNFLYGKLTQICTYLFVSSSMAII